MPIYLRIVYGCFCPIMADELLCQRPFVAFAILSTVAQQTTNCNANTVAFHVPCISLYYDIFFLLPVHTHHVKIRKVKWTSNVMLLSHSRLQIILSLDYDILVFSACCNKLLHWWFKITQVYILIVFRGQKSEMVLLDRSQGVVRTAVLSEGGSREECFLAFFQLLELHSLAHGSFLLPSSKPAA